MSESLFTLEEAREAYRRVSRRADRVIELVEQLRAKRLWLGHKQVVQALALECWNQAAEDVMHDSPSPQELLEQLISEGEAEVPVATDEIDGESAVVINPFFSGSQYSFANAVGLSYLAIAPDAGQLMSGKPVSQPVGLSRSGASDWEVELLTNALCNRALTLVNEMRILHTALQYVRTARSGKYKSCSPEGVVQEDEGIDALLDRLEVATTLGFLPEPDTHFSSRSGALAVLPREALELGLV